MIEINTWLKEFLSALKVTFADRVWFVGLQGSYGRGEATPSSDIDLVVILDELSASDIRKYNAMLDTLPYRELLCGFLSGKNTLLHWEPSDLFQLYYDTKPIKGSLNDLLPMLDDAAVCRAVKIGACNVFHICVHNMLYEKSEEILKGLYKTASFIVQALAFRQTGTHIRRLQDLLPVVSSSEREIIEIFLHLKNGGEIAFDKMSDTLYAWVKNQIENAEIF